MITKNVSTFYDQLWLTTYYEDMENEIQELDNIFQVYLPPVLILLGTLGNIATICVMRTKQFRTFSISFYVLSYAVCNLLMLYLFLGSEWIANISRLKPIDTQTDWLCRVWQFISRVISYSGIWIVVAMLVDRYIIIWYPRKATSLCTVFMAKFTTVFIVVGLIVVSIHAMWTFELMKNSGCYPFFQIGDIHALVWPWVAASFYSYIPLTLIVILNVLISCGLILKLPSKSDRSNSENISLVLTYTTLGLSTLYFVLVLPPTVVNVIDKTYPPSWLQDKDRMIRLAKSRYATHYMAWINTIILFNVCIFFSRTFRKTLKKIIIGSCCIRFQHTIYEMQTDFSGSEIQFRDACTETTSL